MSQTAAALKQNQVPEAYDIFASPSEERTYNVLLMGMPGIGKSTLACQAPPPVVLLDIEKGAHGLVPSAKQFPEIRNVDIRRPKSISEVDKMFWEIRAGRIPCQSLVLDTATEMQAMHLNEVRDARNEEVNTLPEYNHNLNVMRKHFIAFRDLPINFIIVTQVIQDDDEVEGKIIRPDLTPKLASIARSMVDVIGYLTLDRKPKPGGKPGEFIESRILTCTPSKKVWTKNRLGITEPIVNPTWDKMINSKKEVSELKTT